MTTAQLIQQAAAAMTRDNHEFHAEVSTWLTGVAFALQAHRISAGSAEVCHAHRIAAAYLGVQP